MTTEAPSLDTLRAFAFGEGSKGRKSLVECGGHTYEVRTPSYGVKAEADAASFKIGEDGKPQLGDTAERDAIFIVNCTYLPGTEQRVFNVADVKSIKNSAAGGLFAKLAEAIGKLVQEATALGKPEPKPEAET